MSPLEINLTDKQFTVLDMLFAAFIRAAVSGVSKMTEEQLDAYLAKAEPQVDAHVERLERELGLSGG